MKSWIEKHPDLWEFIKFNILSNVSTIARFVMTWIGTAVFINGLKILSPFKFLIFDYTSEGSHGLGGFLTFLIAEVIAQVVNFFVQKTWVFKSNADFSKSAPKYAILAARSCDQLLHQPVRYGRRRSIHRRDRGQHPARSGRQLPAVEVLDHAKAMSLAVGHMNTAFHACMEMT